MKIHYTCTLRVNRRVWNAVLGYNLKNDRLISVHFQGKPFNITVIQIYALTSHAEKAEAERFYEGLPDLLELIPKKDVLFIIGDWNAKVRSQEIPGVTGTLALEYCWGPAWGTPPMAKVMRKEAWHTQRRDQASGNPLFPSIYPKTRVCFMLSPITISLREGVNLQLQVNKNS